MGSIFFFEQRPLMFRKEEADGRSLSNKNITVINTQGHATGTNGFAFFTIAIATFFLEGSTVWIFSNFTATQILREINFCECGVSKSAILTILTPLNFGFSEFLHFP